MAAVTPPKYTLSILRTLEEAGHTAFLVGGCVRDMLMDRRPQDWDICTSALPEAVLELFPGALPTGLKHGTVTVRLAGRHIEVTTFRADGDYTDHRRPDSVRFLPELRGDLERRDFTMNAIARSRSGELTDPFGGREDIAAGLIRCVGEPELRFREDALRMFRAFRFSSRLSFTIHPDTLSAIRLQSPLAASLAAERVHEEVERILLSPAPATLEQLLGLHLLDAWLSDPGAPVPDLSRLHRLPKKRSFRWAALAACLQKSGMIRDGGDFALALRLDHRTVQCCAAAAVYGTQPFPTDTLSCKKLIAKHGPAVALCCGAAGDALAPGNRLRRLQTILRSGDCLSLKELAVSGDDLLALGIQGRALGAMLQMLLEHVLLCPEENRRERLLELAGEKRNHL